MEGEDRPSLLDSHTPGSVIALLEKMPDATADIVALIKATPHAGISKLRQVFQAVDNYDMDAVCGLTQSANRAHRYTATHLVLSKIKALCKRKARFDQIESMYDNVFVLRFRDVDPLIRGMAVQFVAEWIAESPVLHKMDYLRYLGWALNDRNDSVRKRAVRSLARVALAFKSRYGLAREGSAGEIKENRSNRRGRAKSRGPETSGSSVFRAFVDKFKDRLIEMAKFDVNALVQKDAADLVLLVFSGVGCFSEDEALEVLGIDEAVTARKQECLGVLLPDSIWNLERIHEVLKKSSPRIFRSFSLKASDLELFILNVSEFIQNSSSCCDSDSLCFLDVLRDALVGHGSSVDPAHFLRLIEIAKDNARNICKIVDCLASLGSLKGYSEATARVLEAVRGICLEAPPVVESFSPLLKKLEADFGILVAGIVEEFEQRILEERREASDAGGRPAPFQGAVLPLIRNFDITDVLHGGSRTVEKCYGALWLITRGEYCRIERMEFADADRLLDLVDFLILFYTHGDVDAAAPPGPADCDAVFDSVTAFRCLFAKLHALIARSPGFCDEKSCCHLYKLVSLGLFADSAHLLFEHSSLEALTYFIENAVNIRPLVRGFFEAVGKNMGLSSLAKALSARIQQLERRAGDAQGHASSRFVFEILKEHVRDRPLLDTVLVHFVPALTTNECIVLEGMAEKSRFKAACFRRCRVRGAGKAADGTAVAQ